MRRWSGGLTCEKVVRWRRRAGVGQADVVGLCPAATPPVPASVFSFLNAPSAPGIEHGLENAELTVNIFVNFLIIILER